MWTCTNDHWVCERLHGFYYGCTASFIRLAVNNGYLKFGVVGDSVTVSCCTVYSHDSTASTVDFEDDCAHSNLLVKTVYFTICLKYWVWKYHRTNLVYGYHRVTLTGRCIALIPVVGYSNVWRPGGRTLQAAAEKVLVRYKTCSIIPPVAVVTFYQTLLAHMYKLQRKNLLSSCHLLILTTKVTFLIVLYRGTVPNHPVLSVLTRQFMNRF